MRNLDQQLILKFTHSTFFLGAVLLVWSGIDALFAAEAPSADDALIAALPEKSLPEMQAALARAMSQSSRVISSLLDLEQASVGEKVARAPMLPSASASAGFGEAENRYDYKSYWNPTGKNPVTGDNTGATVDARTSKGLEQNLSYNASISQPVYRWGALKKGYQSAKLQHAITTRNVSEIRRALAIDIRRAYFGLMAAANSLEAEKVALANLEKEKIFLKQQAADGFITQSTADYTDVRIKDFKLQMRRSQNNFASLWLSFCELTGNDRASAAPDFPKEIPAINSDLSPALPNLKANSDTYVPASILNADDALHVERLNYEIASTRLRPYFGVSLNASRGYNSPDLALGIGGPYLLTSYGANATVNWSIFDGFSTQAAKQSSLIRQRQLKNSRDQVERDYSETLKNQVESLRINWQSLQRTEEILREVRSSAEVVGKDYEAGMVPKASWDSAQASAEGALQSANNARADYYLQIANYLSMRGKDPAVTLAPKK
jgi:outer membrane protein TolC